MKHLVIALVVIAFFGGPWLAQNYPVQTVQFISATHKTIDFAFDSVSNAAAVMLSHNPRTIADLLAHYAGALASSDQKTVKPEEAAINDAFVQTKVKVLIVPGHEPNYGGAEYTQAGETLKERDMTVELADELYNFLAKDGHYEVHITRNTHVWSPEFDSYFKNDWNNITAWYKAHKDETKSLKRVGQFRSVKPKAYHNAAPAEVALRLYGINKWVNEKAVDIVIHVHINDAPDRSLDSPGKYSGFAIYVPEKQYDNSSTTYALADTVFKRLKKYNPVSNLPGESAGIVEDQDLIAVGSLNTVDAASMLIEYGYIYEPQFMNDRTRELALKDMAYQTYLGLTDFFDPNKVSGLSYSYDTLVVPHTWNEKIPVSSASHKQTDDIFALQTAFLLDGVYPPVGKSKNDCPRTGAAGECTRKALTDFQKKYGIEGESGIVGEKTLEKLNTLFGIQSL